MSKQVDERIVSMQFDNRHFEKNVHTSMSTLDKLKQKLNLSGAAKGLDNLNASARKVDMSSLGNGVEAVRSKFSALEVMGVTALANITNSAVNAGKKIVAALTIDPVKTGLQEYETQINATQTILSNTSHQGTTLEDVNKALDELNKYADLTIYNFTEMTKNIGTFTAAGLDLDTSVKGIQGIANLAAVSGSTSEQASRAMYQLSQALAAGKMNLQDWNSVVNAGMGGKIFQNALARTAKDLGNSVAFDAIEAGETFRNLLNPKDYGDWLTSDVLIATLSKFTKTGAVEYLAELYNISGDSIKELQELGDTTGYNTDEFNKLALSIANGNQETAKYITDTLSMADTATDAATEVKTLSQLWDTLKETAQSGWTQTWELIIGDFDQAKKLFSGLYSFFSGIIEKSSDFRNKLIGGAMGNPFSDFLDKINNSTIGKTVDKVNKLAMSLDEYQKVVNQVWHGDYQNAPVRFELLEEAGYNHKVIQDLVNKGLDYKLTVDDVAESEKKFGVSVKETTKNIEELSDEQLKNAGLTKEEIRMYRDLEKQSKKTGKSIQELVDEMGKKDGRTLLLESFKNAGMGLVTVLKAIKDAWLEVFPPPTVIQLYNIISAMNEFSQKLKVSEETADKVKKTFKGLFSILHIISTVVGGALNTAFKILKQVLGAFNLNILDITASIGDAIVKFDEWLTSVFDFTGVIKAVVPYLIEAGAAIKEWFSGIKDADNIPKYIVEGLVTGLINGVKLVGQAAIELGKAILEKIKDFLGIHSPSTEFIEVGQNIVSGLVIGIQNGASTVWEAIKGIFEKVVGFVKGLNWGTILAAALSGGMVFAIVKIAKALEKLASPIEGIEDVLTGFGEALRSLGKYLKGLAFSVRLNAIKNLVLAISLLVGAVILLTFFNKDKLWDSVKILGAIVGILAALVLVVSGLTALSNKFGAGTIKFSAITLGLIGISASLLILAEVIKRIGSINPEEAKRGFIGLTGLIIELGILLAAYGLLVKGKSAMNIGGLGKSLLKISIALLILVGVIAIIANMSTRDLLKGLAVISLLGLFFTAIVAVSKLAGTNATKAGKMFLQMSVALWIITHVMKIIAGMTWEELERGVAGLAVFASFVLALVLITKLGGVAVPKLGGMFLAMAVAIGILSVVVALISGMEWGELAKGFAGIVVLGLIVSALVGVAAKYGGAQAKLAGTLLAMAIAIGILAVIAALLGNLDVTSLAKGIIAVGFLSLFVSLLLKASKGASASVGSIVALIAAVAVFTGALVALSFVDTDSLLASAISLAAVMVAFALMTAAASLLKGTDKIVGKLAPILGVVVIIAAILGIMAVLDIEPSIETAGSIAILLDAMAVAMLILGKAKVAEKGVMKNLAIMTAVVAGLAIILAAMSFLPSVDNLIPVAVSLSILLEAMAVAMVILGEAKIVEKRVMANLAIMIAVVAGLGVILAGMSLLQVESAIPNAVALSILLEAMAVAMAILGVAKIVQKQVMINLAIMTAVVAGLGAILWGISALDVQNAIPNAIALSTLLIAMTAAMAILGVTKSITPNTLVNLGIIELVVVGLGAVLWGMSALEVENAIPNAIALSTLLIAMSAACLILGGAGSLALPALAGIGVLAALIVAMGALMIGIGALVEHNPKLEEFLDKSIPILEKICTAIGSFFGNIIGGFIGGIATGALPVIGQDLSDFMDNAGGFIDGAKNIKQDTMEGVKTLAGVIMTLTGANLLESLNKILTLGLGKSSIEVFSEQLPMLATGINNFGDTLNDFDETKKDGIQNAADALLILARVAKEIPNSGGLVGAIVGNNDIGDFITQIKDFGTTLASCANSLIEAGFSDAHVAIIEIACKALERIARAAEEIPNTGGLSGLIFGNNDIGPFVIQLGGFATNVSTCAKNLMEAGFSEAHIAIIELACDALKKIASAAKQIPNTGGLVGAIVGNNDIGTFASQLTALGEGLTGLTDKLGSFGKEQLKAVSNAAKAIVTMSGAAKSVDNQAEWTKVFVGDNSISKLSEQFPKLGTNLHDFASNLGTFSEAQVETVRSAVQAINALAGLADSDLKGAKKNLEGFGDKIVTLAKDMASFVSGMPSSDSLSTAIKNVEKILKMIDDISGSDANIAANFTKSLKKIGKDGVDKFVEAFTSNSAKTDVKDAGVKLIQQIVKGVESEKSNTHDSFKELAESCATKIETVRSDFYDAGKYLVEGFMAGISDNTWRAEAEAEAMARAAVRSAERELGEHSPSKVFYRVGDYAGQGFINALSDYGDKSYSASAMMARSAKQGLSDSISKIKDIIDSDIDAQPTIRPVLDLSDLKTGMGAVNGLFNSRESLGVIANVGSINARMNRSIQNGTNSDVVSAIDQLRKDLSSNMGNVYNIDGVTYDDGSNISEAVQALVRAARVERRR